MRIGRNDHKIFKIIFGTRAPEADIVVLLEAVKVAGKKSDTKKYVTEIDRHRFELFAAAIYRDVRSGIGWPKNHYVAAEM